MFSAASVPELVLHTARAAASRPRPALEAQGVIMAYDELASRIARVAGMLIGRGLPRGGRVGLLADRTADAVAGLFGIMAAGGAACVLDQRATAADLAPRIRSAGIAWLLIESRFAATAAALGAANVVRLDAAAGTPENWVTDLAAEDDALLLFTSGSSGAPKAVLLTHGNLLANARGVAERTGVTPGDRLLHVMPLFHTNGINNQLIVPFACGASVVLLERFRAETFFGEIAAHHPTYITGVPTIYSRLLAHAPPRGALRMLRFARCGSAPLTSELHRRIESHLGVPLVVSYGLSEATCTSAMNPPAARRVGSVGTALAGQRIAILGPGGGEPVAAGNDGEICIAGPALMKGYVPAQGGDGGPALRDGWLRTGDLGRLDTDGYLTITGRIKDIIIRGGENLSPAAIEHALLQHPSVKACCVLGIPDADLGEVPVAFVVPGDGAPAAERELQTIVAEQLSRAHVPQRIVTMEALPENATGKVDRKRLRTLVTRN